MEAPKHRIKTMTKVSFESSESSASEDGDSVFNKYSCTPPSRQNMKGLHKRRELRKVNTGPKVNRNRTPEGKTGDRELRDINSPPHRWQQREISKQRECDRILKWVTSSNTGFQVQEPTDTQHASDSEANSASINSTNQGPKVRIAPS